MSDDAARPSPEFLATIQPIVLVGGKSTRFGRDKLREPWGEPGHVLVQRPIEVLRSIFGSRVKLCGECDPSILPLADGVIVDEHPGVGPIGGIVSALKHWRGPIFVLAGDMPSFADSDGWNILRAAQRHPDRLAAFASTDRVHPCAGIYAIAALPFLADRISNGNYKLTTAIPDGAFVMVSVEADSVANLNRPGQESERD